MKVRKNYLWILLLVIVLGVGVGIYVHSHTEPAHVSLAAFNTKEEQLTQEAEKIFADIQVRYDQLEKGAIKVDEFKKQMTPLRDQMKKNWDEYKKFTQENPLSTVDRESKTFKEGVALASNVRFNIYTFLINVTEQNLTKQQIEEKHKEYLSQIENKLKQYRELTKDLKSS
ncbi:hypothetical protein [Effusibacillus pohliae]|uniref:hypothetical protein n=1 Tax=Effusibacillus pohliae TaxID=232270 RepID=UPI00037B07D8|nr:hypothetical protein [Effusibacillus pohliae]